METYLAFLKGRYRSVLMGVAIIWIIAFHFAMYGNLLRFQAVDFLFGCGYLGVDIFFFLSAYGLCYSLNSHSIRGFYYNRARRLFPAYLVFLTALFLAFPNSKGSLWIKTALFQITGLSTFAKLDIEWFIPALTILYLLFPLIYKAVKFLYGKGPWAVSIIIALVSILSPLLSRYVFYLFSLRLTIITMGIITYLALRDNSKTTLLGSYVLCAFIGLLYIGDTKLNVSMTGSLMLPLLLYSFSQLQTPISKMRVLPFIGEHSLEIYLAQCLAFNHFMASSQLEFVPTSLIAFAMIPSVAFLLYSFHSGFYYLINYGKRLFRRNHSAE